MKKTRKERNITIKIIENKSVNINRLAEYFSRKYSEKEIDEGELKTNYDIIETKVQ